MDFAGFSVSWPLLLSIELSSMFASLCVSSSLLYTVQISTDKTAGSLQADGVARSARNYITFYETSSAKALVDEGNL